jgi:hypothetical protein
MMVRRPAATGGVRGATDMSDRIEAQRPATAEPAGIVISSGSVVYAAPAAWAFVWGPAEVDEETRLSLAA